MFLLPGAKKERIHYCTLRDINDKSRTDPAFAEMIKKKERPSI